MRGATFTWMLAQVPAGKRAAPRPQPTQRRVWGTCMSPSHCFKEEPILPGWTIFSLLYHRAAVSNTASLGSPWASEFQARTEDNIWPFEMIQEVPNTAWYEKQEESVNLKQHPHSLMLQFGKWQQGHCWVRFCLLIRRKIYSFWSIWPSHYHTDAPCICFNLRQNTK